MIRRHQRHHQRSTALSRSTARWRSLRGVWLSLGLLTLGLPAQAAASHEPEQLIVAEALVDTNGNGRCELLLIDATGSVHRHQLQQSPLGERQWRAAGSIQLRDPTHCLVAFANLLPEPGAELIFADRQGTAACRWTDDDKATAPVVLLHRARNLLRTDQPQLRPFVQDLNRDGRLDVLLPAIRGVQPYLQEAPSNDGKLQFRAMPMLSVRSEVEVEHGEGRLASEHRGSLVVPQVETLDLNGDGRPDLLTRQGTVRSFHLQADDGSFLAPIEVDLRSFVDSTPKAAVAPGSTVVLGDRQQLQRGDIDGDGIPDFVVAHRRKIWTFLGTKEGPQFQKARTQAVAEDISAMLLVDLDDDGRADLLTFQIQLPGLGTLLLGMVQSTDIDIRTVGYRSEDNGFANTPTWRRTITLRIPSLLSLLSQQEELVQRLGNLLSKLRPRVRGDFRGDGQIQLAMVNAEGSALELYNSDPATVGARSAANRELRQVLFEDGNALFDFDRLFRLAAGFLDGSFERLRGDQQPLASLRLRDPGEWQLLRLLSAELDGRPGAELVAVYAAIDNEQQRTYDVLSFAGSAGD